MAEMKASMLEARALHDARSAQLELRGSITQNAGLLRELQVRLLVLAVWSASVQSQQLNDHSRLRLHVCTIMAFAPYLYVDCFACGNGSKLSSWSRCGGVQVMTEDARTARDRTEMALLALKDMSTRCG